MRLNRTTAGTETGHRYELAHELEDLATGWHLRGNDKMAEASLAGARQLRDGEDEVTVGHVLYIVSSRDGEHS